MEWLKQTVRLGSVDVPIWALALGALVILVLLTQTGTPVDFNWTGTEGDP